VADRKQEAGITLLAAEVRKQLIHPVICFMKLVTIDPIVHFALQNTRERIGSFLRIDCAAFELSKAGNMNPPIRPVKGSKCLRLSPIDMNIFIKVLSPIQIMGI